MNKLGRALAFFAVLPLLAQRIDYVTQINRKPEVDVREFQFSRTAGTGVTGSLASAGSNALTFTPCPRGVAGANTNHYLRISGGVGTAETVLITGGTCTSGAASGTVIFTTANTHTGSWSVATATAGAQEAINVIAGKGTLAFPAGTINIYGKISFQIETSFRGAGEQATIIVNNNDAVYAFEMLTSDGGGPDVEFSIAARFSDFTLQTKYGIRVNPDGAGEWPGAWLLLGGPTIQRVTFNGKYAYASDPNQYTTVVPTLAELKGYGVAVAATRTWGARVEDCIFSAFGIAILSNVTEISLYVNNRFIYNARNVHIAEGGSVKIDASDIIGVNRIGGIYIDTSLFATVTRNFFEGLPGFTGSVTIGHYIASTNSHGTTIQNNRFDSTSAAVIPMISLDDHRGDIVSGNTWNPNVANPTKIGNTYWNSGYPNQYLFTGNVPHFGAVASEGANLPRWPGAVLESLDPYVFRHNNVPGNYMAGLCSLSFPFVLSGTTGRWVASCSTGGGLGIRFPLTDNSTSRRFTMDVTARKVGTGITTPQVLYDGNATTDISPGAITFTATAETETQSVLISLPAGEKPNGYLRVVFDTLAMELEEIRLRPELPSLTGSASLNLAAPAVPGCVGGTVNVAGAAVGDVVDVGTVALGTDQIAAGFVASAGVVTVRVCQMAGTPADPDGAGATYKVIVRRQ